jgi:hypothetical protein
MLGIHLVGYGINRLGVTRYTPQWGRTCTLSESNNNSQPYLPNLLKVSIVPTMSNSLEVLANLIFLAEHAANDPLKVCEYMKMADAQLQVLSGILKTLKTV